MLAVVGLSVAATPRQQGDAAATKWEQSNAEQRIAQTWAAYRTGQPAGSSWPGCVGAVKQPLGAGPREARRARNSVQRTVMQACVQLGENIGGSGNKRMPALFFQEALHGAEGDTIFPTPAALGAMWDPPLVRRVMAAIAAGARALGSHAVLAPVLDLFVDGRFGRMQEGFGEDPMHVAANARAAVEGLQGGGPAPDRTRGGRTDGRGARRTDGADAADAAPSGRLLSDEVGGVAGGGAVQSGKVSSGPVGAAPWRRLRPDKVFAIGKHFLGYGALMGGLNGAASALAERPMLEEHLRPWRSFVAAGGAGAMAGHHTILGIPCHAHRRLLHDLLRGELELWGPIFSDCNDIGGLVGFGVAANHTDAAATAMRAGVDVDLQCGRHCSGGDTSADCGAYRALGAALDQGLLEQASLRAAFMRIVALKHAAGLLSSPLELSGSEQSLTASLNSRATQSLAALAAARAVTLLLNRDGMLPLRNRGDGMSPLARAPLPTTPSDDEGASVRVPPSRKHAPRRSGTSRSGTSRSGSSPRAVSSPRAGTSSRSGSSRSLTAATQAAGRRLARRRPLRVGVVGPAGGCGSSGAAEPPGSLCLAQRVRSVLEP